MSVERKEIKLAAAIVIDGRDTISLNAATRFQIGWLRDAPPIPDFFIALVKSTLSKLPWDDLKKFEKLDDQAVLDMAVKDFPVPTGAEVSALFPWMLHIAEKATGEKPDVVDQLCFSDFGKIIVGLLPGMIALVNFRRTPASGEAISPGSSTGAPTT